MGGPGEGGGGGGEGGWWLWRGREKCRELEREVGWVWGGLELGSERLEEGGLGGGGGEILFIRLHQRDSTVGILSLTTSHPLDPPSPHTGFEKQALFLILLELCHILL